MMVPGSKLLEHYLTHALELREFGMLGQLGREFDTEGYKPVDVPRQPVSKRVDSLVRS